MLDLLVKYGEKQGQKSEIGFLPKDVRWAIVCDEDGRFLDVVELGEVGTKRNRGLRFLKCPNLSQPEMKAGGITKSHFLVETADVVTLPRVEDDGKKLEKHRYFINLLRQAGAVMPCLVRLVPLLESRDKLSAIQKRFHDLGVRPTDKVTFRIGPEFPVESSLWHNWWREFRENLVTAKSQSLGRKRKDSKTARYSCFVTGMSVQPLLTHPKIKELSDVGGLTSGDVLIGFKQDSFCSYGLRQSANAAVSEQAAAAYTDALNLLIRETGQRIAGTKVVHWFKKKIERDDDPLFWLEEVQETQELNARQKARDLLNAISMGRRVDLADNQYYAITLSGAAGRVMVRDWMQGEFEELVRRVDNWFDDLSVVRRDGGSLAPLPKFMAVLGATVRDLRDVSPPFAAKMWRVAVKGEPIPSTALAQAMNRAAMDILQDEPANHARMGLIKAYHLRKQYYSGGDTMKADIGSYLNENHPHPAYHCGRLMAVLAALQHRALGDVGAGVVQRYYAAASATPALVLGRLIRTSQFHLNKLQNPGLVRWYENRLAGIWGRIGDSVPRILDMEEQSLFALGYYQELADLRARKTADNTGIAETTGKEDVNE